MARAGQHRSLSASAPRFFAGTSEDDDGLPTFVPVRARLFGIAYRMLGSEAEAEDMVQDVWLRWQSTDRCAVVNAPAFLATTTSRLCINFAKSARTRRETFIGPWLPEPMDIRSDPELSAERGEALKLAFLVLLERLSPKERAAYVLREAFEYPYEQIADILQMAKTNVRQLVSRARKHIADGRRTSVTLGEPRRLLAAFLTAAKKGDMSTLEDILSKDVVHASQRGCAARARQVNDSICKAAPAYGIDQNRWIMPPSGLPASSRSRSRSGEPYAA